MASIENPTNAPLWQRIVGSLLSALAGWAGLVIVCIALDLPWMTSTSVWETAAGGGVFTLGIWILALLPLYLFFPIKSRFWPYLIYTFGGAAAWPMIIFSIDFLGFPGISYEGVRVFAPFGGIVGCFSCLFGSLTKYRFQLRRSPSAPRIQTSPEGLAHLRKHDRSGRVSLVRFILITGAVTLAWFVILLLETALDLNNHPWRDQPQPGLPMFLHAARLIIGLPLEATSFCADRFGSRLQWQWSGWGNSLFLAIPGLFWATVVDVVARVRRNRAALR